MVQSPFHQKGSDCYPFLQCNTVSTLTKENRGKGPCHTRTALISRPPADDKPTSGFGGFYPVPGGVRRRL